MAKYTGQLGTLLEITVPSLLLGCRWSQPEVVAGGEVALLIHTGYVGDGAPVDFRILDENGSQVDKVKGTVRNNVGSAKWTVSDKAKGRLIFLAEAKDVDLVGRSDTLTVFANAGIGPVSVTDSAGKTLAEIPIGQRMKWICRLPGVPDDTPFTWAIQCHQDKAHQITAAAGRGAAKQSQGVVLWESQYPFHQADKKSQKELDQTSETYKDAFFQATFTCLGVTVRSAEVKVRTDLEIEVVSDSSGDRSLLLPKGAEQKVTVSPQVAISQDELSVGESPLEDEANDPMGEDT
jgi:hypothetical protein